VRPSAPERLYDLLLWLHPPAFRRAWRGEILQHVRTAAREDGVVQTLIRAAADGVRSAAREWRDLIAPPPFDTRPGEPMRNLFRDVSLAARLLARTPTFTLAAVLTLALGIGANTAVFTLADATLLRPLPVRAPEQLVTWSWSSSWPHYQEYARRTDIFQRVMASGGVSRLNLSIGGSTQLVQGAFYSGNTFEVLGVPAALGRTLVPADDEANGPVVAVLGHDFWRTRFGADPGIVGRSARINGRSTTIVGVAQEGFRGVALSVNPDLYLPALASGQFATGFFSRVDRRTETGFVWLSVTGRLQPGVSITEASHAMDALYTRLQPPKPGATRDEQLQLQPLETRALGGGAGSVRSFLMMLAGVVGLTLLIACANLANLLLARAAARRREVGVRMALGATRRRIVQQMLSESLLLALIGGAVGVVFATVALGAVRTFELPGGLRLAALPMEINGAVLAVTLGLSLLTGFIFGAAPAWRASRADALASIRGQSRATTARNGLRSLLLAAQVAMSLVLLTGTGLFARSLMAALDSPLGFTPDGATTATVNLGLARYETARARGFYDAAVERVRKMPGVTHAAWSNLLPTRGSMMWNTQNEAGKSITVHSAHVGPDYFAAIGTRVTAGRSFVTTDRAGTEPVTIVNEHMAREFFSGDALGQRIQILDTWVTVVGIAENTIVRGLREPPAAQLYLAFDQWLDGPRGIATDTAHLIVRSSGSESVLIPLVREQLRGLDPELPLYTVEPFSTATASLVLPQRMGATLFTLFSAVALALVTVGIYGVASYVATLRHREIGVRVALGATAGAIRRMMLGQGALAVLGGIAAGLLGALYASRTAAAFLMDVSPWDPVTLTAVTLLLVGVAAGANYLPARRAARLDPIQALREE
jgi:predicted permease